MLDDSDLELVVNRLQEIQPSDSRIFLGEATSTVWIASGLAKISAVYGASLLQRIAGSPSRYVTPLEYVQNQRIYCLPVLISLRGEHADAIEVAKAVVNREVERSILLSCFPLGSAGKIMLQRPASKCQIASVVASAAAPERDERFVNFKSVLTLSAITNRLVYGALGIEKSLCKYSSKLNFDYKDIYFAWRFALKAAIRISDQICSIPEWEQKQLIILTEGACSELGVAWQSVLSEAGVTNPVCLDIKDYTHGDHLVASRTKNAIYLVVYNKDISSVSRIFIDRFSTIFPVISFELQTDRQYNFWENIFTVGGVTSELTGALGYYNKRPEKDPVIWSWRGWGSMN